jgi:hypothetical protein
VGKVLVPGVQSQFSNQNDMISIYPCGTEVAIKGLEKKGTIVSISIQFNRSSYEVAYFHDGSRKTCWLDECEFTTGPKEKQAVGFITFGYKR